MTDFQDDQQRANETQQYENVSQQEQNIEQQDANVAQQVANTAIGPLIVALTREVHDLKTTYKWSRIVRWVLVTIIFFVFLAVVFAVVDNRSQIRNLACYAVRLRPPGYSTTSDSIRSRYHCPPFDPSLATPVPTETVTKTAAVVQPGPTRTVVRSTPSPVRATRTVSGPSITVTRTATATRRVLVPAPTVTVTHTCALLCLPGG